MPIPTSLITAIQTHQMRHHYHITIMRVDLPFQKSPQQQVNATLTILRDISPVDVYEKVPQCQVSRIIIDHLTGFVIIEITENPHKHIMAEMTTCFLLQVDFIYR